MKYTTRTVARSGTETVAPLATRDPANVLQLELKRRIAAAHAPAVKKTTPASSIREALSRWLEEEL